MITEILSELWGTGVSFILLAFVMKLFFSKKGMGTIYFLENAKILERNGQNEYAERLNKMSAENTSKERFYFRALLITGVVIICASLLAKI